MKVKIIDVKGCWSEIANSARTTIGLRENANLPKSGWKRKVLLAEHSMIRKLIISWKWYDIPYWISNQLTRHKLGIEHFVKTQRTDKTGIDRNKLPQDEPVTYEAEANAQAIINISRRRLCSNSSKETRQTWELFLKELKEYEPELYSVCVPDCIYRGWCYEYKTCDYHTTPGFRLKLDSYRGGIN